MKDGIKFILANLIKLILLIMAISLFTFFLVSVSPVEPLSVNVGQTALGQMSREQIEKIEEYWGENEPPIKRFLSWSRGLIRGDMGTSLLYRKPVSEVIARRLKNSLVLMGVAWVLSGIIGFLMGCISGMNAGKKIDKIIKGYCIVISSTSAFYIAMLLLIVFAVALKIFPVGFSAPIGSRWEDVTVSDAVRHAVLPALALSITGVARVAMHTREKVVDIMGKEFILFSVARGESRWRIFKSHCLRNVLAPAIMLQFAEISEIFGGSVLVEQVFSYPGLGNTAVRAGLGSDLPLLMSITVISGIIVFIGNFTANILQRLADPRIRRGGKKL